MPACKRRLGMQPNKPPVAEKTTVVSRKQQKKADRPPGCGVSDKRVRGKFFDTPVVAKYFT
jgi:hypothetical protein